MELPKPEITNDEFIWMHALYQKFLKGETVYVRKLKAELWGKIPTTFDPYKINAHLVTGGVGLTLLGVWTIDPNTDLIEKADKVINFIKEFLINNPEHVSIKTEQISNSLGLEIFEVTSIIKLIGSMGRFYSSASGFTQNNIHMYSDISFGSDDVFDQYYQYNNIEQLLSEFFYKSLMEESKEQNAVKLSQVS